MAPEILVPEPLDAIPVTEAVLFLVHANVVLATVGLVPNTIVVKALPEQMFCAPLVTVAVGVVLTVIVIVPVIWRVQPVVEFVANTLNTVVLFNVPVFNVIVPPVPLTALPTKELSALFRN